MTQMTQWTRDKADKLLNDIMLLAQKMRSNAHWGIDQVHVDGGVNQETKDKVLADLFPYLFSDGSESVILKTALTMIQHGYNGQQFYNLLTLCQRDLLIKRGYEAFHMKPLPKPDIKMIVDLGID